jgi:hypothetical protein
MIRQKNFNKILLVGFVMAIAILLSSLFLQAHLYYNNSPRSYIKEVDSARHYVFSIVNEREDTILRTLKSIKSHTYSISHQEIFLQNNQELSIDHGILMNAIINGLDAKVSKVIIGTRSILINITFIGVSEIIIQGDYNMIIGTRINKTRGVFVKGSNNLLYDVSMSHVAMGIKIINSYNNTIWKFNVSYVGYLPVGESPKIIAIINGNNNLIAHGIGVAPYPNWGIYIERGANNIVFNVTIASAHNYFKFSEVESLFIVNCQATRKHKLYGDDYFEGSVARNGKVFIMNSAMIGSGADALLLSGRDGVVYVVNPYFFKSQSLISFYSYYENLTVIFINTTLSLVETKTWYRSYIPYGVKLVLINTTFTLLEFIYCKGTIETYPLPLFISLLKDTIKVFWKVLIVILAFIFVPPVVVNFIIRKVVNNERT